MRALTAALLCIQPGGSLALGVQPVQPGGSAAARVHGGSSALRVQPVQPGGSAVRSVNPRALLSMAATEDGGGPIIDTVARELLDSIVQGELAELAEQPPEAQEAALPTLLSRVEQRAVAEAGALAESGGKSYQFGDLSKSVVESVRGEVQRQVEADWSTDDISLLLKVCLFLGAGTAAPVAGLAAMPAAVLLATYGTVLKAELGVRAVQEVGVRLAERAAQGVADGVRGYTGKDEYRFGDLTEETVHRVTGSDEYRFGDLSKGALRSVTGKTEYEFGDVSKSLFRRLTGHRGGGAEPDEAASDGSTK